MRYNKVISTIFKNSKKAARPTMDEAAFSLSSQR